MYIYIYIILAGVCCVRVCWATEQANLRANHLSDTAYLRVAIINSSYY